MQLALIAHTSSWFARHVALKNFILFHETGFFAMTQLRSLYLSRVFEILPHFLCGEYFKMYLDFVAGNDSNERFSAQKKIEKFRNF